VAEELVEQELRGEEDGYLTCRSRINEIDALPSTHREVDERECDLVHPAEVDPLRAAAVLKDEPALASDRDKTRGVLVLDQELIPGWDLFGDI
jgi:hypothetical protein